MIRTYSELISYPSFEERYDYLRLQGQVGAPTFGYDRYINQRFYTSAQWKSVRDEVITRDLGCDLACSDYEIFDRIVIHHMNPMTPEGIVGGESDILDPEFLICTTHRTHNAIHYGDSTLLSSRPIERRPGDTVPWRRRES